MSNTDHRLSTRRGAPFSRAGACIVAMGAFLMAGCGKEAPTTNPPATKPSAKDPPPTAPAVTPPPKPAPSGPLQSRTGTRTARLELLPSGRVMLTVLAKNRQDTESVEAAELTGIVMFDGGTEDVKFVPRPGVASTDGKHTQFVGYSERLKQGLGGTIGVTFPSGEPKVAQFQIPPGYRSY